MTDTAPDGVPGRERPADPFVAQVAWLIAAAGGKDQLVARSGNLVSARTLDNWVAGVYPRAKVTGAVRDIDAWAVANMPGYPSAAGVPRLTESCGPYRGARAEDAAGVEAGVGTASGPAAGPLPAPPSPRPRWMRWALVAGALALVIAVAVVTTALVMSSAEAREEAREAAAATAAPNLAKLRLPSTGDGVLRPEQAGSIGANTFADPRTLLDRALPIPPHTTVMVRCRYYAPSIPSVTPDGFWYLIDAGQWAGRWTPANSFMNGDLPGQPTLHNTDFAVPVCR